MKSAVDILSYFRFSSRSRSFLLLHMLLILITLPHVMLYLTNLVLIWSLLAVQTYFASESQMADSTSDFLSNSV